MKLSQKPEIKPGGFKNLIQAFMARMLPPGTEPGSGLPYWREVILLYIVSLGVSLGLVAYLPGMRAVLNEGQGIIAGAMTALYLAVVLMFIFYRRLSYTFRTLTLIIVVYLIGTLVLISLGPISGGPVWLFGFALFSGVLLGMKVGLLALGLNLLTMSGVGILLGQGTVGWAMGWSQPLTRWWALTANFTFLSSIVTVLVTLLAKGLQATAESERQATDSLRGEVESRRRAEAAIKESEEKYRTVFDQARDTIYISNPQGRILDLNRAGLAFLGGPGKDPGKIDLEEVYEEPGRRARELERLERDGSILDSEIRLRRHDGQVRTCLDSATVWRDRLGKTIGYIGSVRDITEAKEAEKALQESQRRLATLMSNLPGMAYRCRNDRDWTMEFCSEGCLELTGYRTEDLVNNRKLSYARIIHPADLSRVVEEVEKALSQGTHFQIQYRITTAQGEEKWVWEQGLGVETPGGKVETLEGFITDITERRRAEAALARREERYRLLVENAPLGVLAIDGRGVITEANPVLLEILGSPSAEATKKINIFDYQPLIEAGITQDFKTCLEEGRTITGEHPYTTKWGKKVVLRYHLNPIIEGDGSVAGVQAVLEDFSKIRETEQALRESERRSRLLFSNMNSGLAFHQIVTDEKGQPVDYIFLEVNEAFEGMTGLKAEEIIGRRATEIHGPRRDFEFDWIAAYGTVALEGKNLRFERYSPVFNRWLSISAYSPAPGFFATVSEDITERKEAEEGLQASEEKYRTVFDQARDIVYLTTPEGRFVDLNQAGLDFFGCTREELDKLRVEELYADSRDRQGELETLETNGFVKDYEIRLRRSDGRARYCLDTASIWKDEKGGIIGYVGSIRDITERKLSDEALRISEERYRLLVENAHEAIVVVQDNRLRFFNRKMLEVTGYRPEELVALTLPQLIHPEDQGDIAERQKKRLAGEDFPRGRPVRILDRRGGERWVEISSVLIDWEERPAILAFLTDVTERRQAEEALRLSEEKFSKAFQESPVWVVLSNLDDGRYLEVNETFLATTGFKREEVIDRTSLAVGTWVDPRQRQRVVEEIKARGSLRNMEVERRTKSGRILTMLFSGEIISFGGMELLLSVSLDISDRKKEEEARANLERQLRQSQKMEAIGTLAGGIAHDFNNILAAIMGYTELSLSQMPKRHPSRQNLDQVLKAGERARKLVQQILSFSRRSEHDQRPVELEPIIEEALKLLRATIPTTIEIKKDLEPGLGKVMADPTQIHQMVMNLATNAAQAMERKGGVMEVGLKGVELDATSVGRHPDLALGEYLLLTVSDTGTGMDAQTMERIFEPFFTTKPTGAGTGMGLSVVHGIVKSCGGAVSVYSEPGQGAAFKVYLPLMGQGQEAAVRLGREPIPRGRESILYVDDEESLVDMGRQMLEFLGYQVVATTSSLEAWELFESDPRRFDLIITDQTMPQMTGLELSKGVLGLRPEIPIILSTGFSALVSAESAQEMGIRRMLFKPFNIREAAKAIREVLEGGGQGPG